MTLRFVGKVGGLWKALAIVSFLQASMSCNGVTLGASRFFLLSSFRFLLFGVDGVAKGLAMAPGFLLSNAGVISNLASGSGWLHRCTMRYGKDSRQTGHSAS